MLKAMQSNSSGMTFHFPAPSLVVRESVAPSIKPLLLLKNEHSAGSRSEAAINNKPADKDTVTGFDITLRRTPLNAAGGEDGSDRYRGERGKRGTGSCCSLRRETQQGVQFRADQISPKKDPCRSTLTNFGSRI